MKNFPHVLFQSMLNQVYTARLQKILERRWNNKEKVIIWLLRQKREFTPKTERFNGLIAWRRKDLSISKWFLAFNEKNFREDFNHRNLQTNRNTKTHSQLLSLLLVSKICWKMRTFKGLLISFFYFFNMKNLKTLGKIQNLNSNSGD